MKILIIDDDKNTLEILKIHLSKNHEVTIYFNPQEAFEEFQKNPNYSIVITDYKMPNLGGDEIIERIFKLNHVQNFIFCTCSYDDELPKIILEKKDFIHVVSKPIDFLALDNSINSILEKIQDDKTKA
ncbi:MAG: hypothetical protein COA79_20825 [Planctomycetota bacterium]|nr:MAG: hypothetical protein COA79_20825 [Planctomycetota bacterium]